MKITVWNEFAHEKSDPAVKAIYPDGIHQVVAGFLREAGYEVRTATLDDPECGLTDEVLDDTDVLFWWGHMRHGDVPDAVVSRVYRHVIAGMGMVVLHSGHASKIFQKLMGTPSGELKWRESGDKEILWVIEQGHPITRGIGEKIILEHGRPTASTSSFPSRTSSCSSAGSRAAKSSAPAAYTSGAAERSSISVRVTNPSRPTTIPTSRKCW